MRIMHLYRGAVALAACLCAIGQAQNQVVSVGFTPSFSVPSLPAVAPGGIVTLFATDLGVPDAVAGWIPLPDSLSGVSVQARVIGATSAAGYPSSLPILRVFTRKTGQMPSGVDCPANSNVYSSSTQITVEIPTEEVCAPAPVPPGIAPENCSSPPFIDLPPLLVLNVSANGVAGPDIPLQVVAFVPHFLNSCDSIFSPQSSSTCHPLVTHADGSLVSDDSPAKAGEVIVVYGVGFGYPAAPTGYAPTVPFTLAAGGLTFAYVSPLPGYSTLPNQGGYSTAYISVAADWAGLIPGHVGLYQINVAVPPSPTQTYQPCAGGNANIAFPGLDSGTLSICVQP